MIEKGCLIITNNGHGVSHNNKCVDLGGGYVYREWIMTRIIKMMLVQQLYDRNIPYLDLVPFCDDVPIENRLKKEKLYTFYKNRILLDIHTNAFTDSKANGVTCYSSMNENKSDVYADLMTDFLKPLPFFDRFDTDAKGLKGRDANFKILRESTSWAMTLELGFSTNPKDLKLLLDFYVQNDIACRIANFCEHIQNLEI